MKILFGALLLLASELALAASSINVLSLQFPAWVERNGLSIPLGSGVELQGGDQVKTGAGGRVQIRFQEGSIVKLGENATFLIDKAALAKDGVFRAGLRVLAGAFRFTTDALFKSKGRDVRIDIVRNATIGIRGTDVWGRARDDKDIVCLIEGRIEVTGNDGNKLQLDQALQLFQSTRKAPPGPLTFIDPRQLAVLALETELEEGKGAATLKGAWRVVASGFANRNERLAAYHGMRAGGYPAELGASGALHLDGLASEADAQALAASLKGKFPGTYMAGKTGASRR